MGTTSFTFVFGVLFRVWRGGVKIHFPNYLCDGSYILAVLDLLRERGQVKVEEAICRVP
jgi:hypothetical protein